MYRVVLTDAQRAELHERTRQPDTTSAMRDRLEMVRLSDSGFRIPWIASHLGLHQQTVRKFIKAFLSGGFDALSDKPRPGKVSAFTPEMRAALRAEIEKGERTWTAPQMADWLKERFDLSLSPNRVTAHMKREGLVYKRTSRTLAHKQDAQQVDACRTTLEMLKRGPQAG
jgi:putative transposase